jgi:tripartite-type tricarboxylate transporter receptor subunit TctC
LTLEAYFRVVAITFSGRALPTPFTVHAAKKSNTKKVRARSMYRILSLLWLGWALVGNAAAQDFPSKPVMFTVPFAAGGPADVIGRILANGMSKVLNQQFVVENTVGAGGTIGTARVAASPPDGYSLLLMHISHAANVAFYPNLRYDPIKDFEPIGLVAESPMAIVARKDFPASNARNSLLTCQRTTKR